MYMYFNRKKRSEPKCTNRVYSMSQPQTTVLVHNPHPAPSGMPPLCRWLRALFEVHVDNYEV